MMRDNIKIKRKTLNGYSLVIYFQVASYAEVQVPSSALENHAKAFVVVTLVRVEAISVYTPTRAREIKKNGRRKKKKLCEFFMNHKGARFSALCIFICCHIFFLTLLKKKWRRLNDQRK